MNNYTYNIDIRTYKSRKPTKNELIISFGFIICDDTKNYSNFVGTVQFLVIDNMYLIEDNIFIDNDIMLVAIHNEKNIFIDNDNTIISTRNGKIDKLVLNILLKEKYIEKLTNHKFNYKLSSKTLLNLI